MRSKRRFVYLLAAFCLAALVFWVTQSWLDSEVSRATVEAEPSAPSTTRNVLVASEDLSPGTILSTQHLAWQPWPTTAISDAYVTQEEASIDNVAGSVARNALFRGEPITTSALGKPGEGSVMSAVLRPGYRAVTISVSASTGVAGFVSPGDRVDLILSRVVDAAGGSKRVTTDTVLSDARVVGVDQRVANQQNEVVAPQTATIEVTPEQAELVVAASELGKLTLALRSVARGEEQVPPPDVTPSWLVEGTQAVPRRTIRAASTSGARGPSTAVEVVRGTRTSAEGSSR